MSNILGLTISHLTMRETVARCLSWLDTPGTKLVFTPNPEIAVYAFHHPDYYSQISTADLLIPDGMGIYLAGRAAIPERVTGVDLMGRLLTWANANGSTVGFVLRRDGLSTLEALARSLQVNYPQLHFTCWHEDEVPAADDVQFLFVGLGFPAQEQWCYQRRHAWPNVKVMFAVGGSLDYLTGQQRRAPSFLRKIGLEWLWRLGRQPKRLKRILTATLVFPWLIFKTRYGQHR